MSRNLRPVGPLTVLVVVLAFGPVEHPGATEVQAVSSDQDASHSGPDGTTTVTRLSSDAPGVIELSDKRVRVPLGSGAPSEAGRTPAARLSAPSAPRRLYLVVKDLQAVRQPGTLFHLYLDLPEGVTPKKDDPRHVGSMNFYDAIREPRVPATTEGGPRGVDASYDITEVVKRLKAKRLLADHASVTIIATTAPEAASAPTVGRIEIVEQ